jgi:hypothetical protein
MESAKDDILMPIISPMILPRRAKAQTMKKPRQINQFARGPNKKAFRK